MSTLKAFRGTGCKCNWPGCNSEAVVHNFKVVNKTTHCLRHTMYKLSGRVSNRNWARDHYREHMKSRCALSGYTWSQAYNDVKAISKNLNNKLTKRQLIVLASRQFQVDHIDGNHDNNDISNLQTLTAAAHKIKSELAGDFIAYRK